MNMIYRKLRRRLRRNRSGAIALSAGVVAVLLGMYFIINDARGYRQAEQLAQDVDISNVCYIDDDPYYRDYVSAAPIPLMTLDKQSDDAPAEVDDDVVLATFRSLPWAADTPLGYQRSYIPGWLARGPALDQVDVHTSRSLIGRSESGAPCKVVIGKVPEASSLSFLLLATGLMFFLRARKDGRCFIIMPRVVFSYTGDAH